MADHVRLQALKKLCELLENETGLKVYRGRQVVGADIPLPFLNISESIRNGQTHTTSDNIARNDRVDFLLSGYADTKSVTHPIDAAYEQLVKIETAFSKIFAKNLRTGNPLYKEWYNLGGLVSNFEYHPPVCHNPADDVHNKAYFYVFFSFNTAYDSSNPTGIS